MSDSTLEHLPGEVLQQIAVSLSALTFLGPPSDVLSMLLLSKRVRRQVSWIHVHAAIFYQKFDISAPVRRLGGECKVVSALAAELAKRFGALKRLKNDAYLDLDDAEILRLDLWTAYIMFLEHEGKNAKQLVTYARVDIFAANYIYPEGPLHDGSDENENLIVDSENNALAVWLFWFTDKYRVDHESPHQRCVVLQALFWLYVGSFEYPATRFPLTTFRIPASDPGTPPTLDSTDSTLSWSTEPACTVPEHFGVELTLTKPLISTPAYLSTAVRSATVGAKDWSSIQTALVEWGDEQTGIGDGAKFYDADWARLRTCHEPLPQPAKREHAEFKPGTLHGKWVGRWVYLRNQDDDENIVSEIAKGPNHMQLYIREHHQNRKDDVLGYDDISHDGIGSGLLNAWLPRNTTMKEVATGLRVYNPNTRQSSTYRTYSPDAAAEDDIDDDETAQDIGLYGRNVHDVLLTAQSFESFGKTEGHYLFEGRVRDCDGLVTLVRRSEETKLQWLFFGQVHGGRNIVGRWRDTTTPIDGAGMSGVWCMTKEDE